MTKLLIADDDAFFRRLLVKALGADHEVVPAEDGWETWQCLQAPDSPRLLILDYVMPNLTGPELCRKIRSTPRLESAFIIILTAKNDTASLVSALHAGADDYVTKPFAVEELRARIRVGERVLDLQCKVAAQIASLQNAVLREKQLRSLLPVCPTCGEMRTDKKYWGHIERYARNHNRTSKLQGACPSCSGRA